MDRSILEETGINYDDSVTKYFAGHAELYEKYLKRFVSDTTFPQLVSSMEQEDYATAFRAAHTLKGQIGQLGMENLYEDMKAFVELLRDEADIPQAKAQFPALRDHHDRVARAIAQSFGS